MRPNRIISTPTFHLSFSVQLSIRAIHLRHHQSQGRSHGGAMGWLSPLKNPISPPKFIFSQKYYTGELAKNNLSLW